MKNRLTSLLLALICCMVSYAQEQSEATAWNHFVWGAEAGGAIDMTSNDMSTINLDAFFGYKNSWINALGIGASVNIMVSNSVRSFPVYAMFRTGFKKTPTLLFMDLRGGCVFNNINNNTQQTRLYLSPGVGINLARGRSFTSYITVSYVYNGLSSFAKDGERYDINGLSMALVLVSEKLYG